MSPIEFGPIRTIKDDLVISPTAPRLAVRFAPSLIYLGDLQYIRRETFYVEEFILINTNGLGHLTQMLLVHFAGYLENQEGRYEYPQSPVATLAGDTYLLDQFTIALREPNAKPADTEVSRSVDYIRQRAYTLPGDLACQRFRRVVSDDRRREFAILYAEPADPTLPEELVQAENASHPQASSLAERQISPNPVTPETLFEHAMKAFEIIKE